MGEGEGRRGEVGEGGLVGGVHPGADPPLVEAGDLLLAHLLVPGHARGEEGEGRGGVGAGSLVLRHGQHLGDEGLGGEEAGAVGAGPQRKKC